MKSKRIDSETLLHPVARYKWIYDKESLQSKRTLQEEPSQTGTPWKGDHDQWRRKGKVEKQDSDPKAAAVSVRVDFMTVASS